MNNSKFKIFSTIIPLKAHVQAEKFSHYQYHQDKIKQVYLNTLTVSTVSSYLNSLGWVTNLENSNSWNPLFQTMMDIGDLLIPSYGKLECRFFFKGESSVNIPPEVWSERIGYVIVELESSLRYASVVGFVRRVRQENFPLDLLESLNDFPAYLSQQKKAEPNQPATLNKWFSHHQDLDWKSLNELFDSSASLNFRGKPKVIAKQADNLSSEVQKIKLIELEKQENLTIALILNIRPKDQQEFDISLMVCNSNDNQFLPKGLEIIITDQDHHPTMIAQTNETETIEFCFSGQLGEYFSLELAWNEKIIIENFMI